MGIVWYSRIMPREPKERIVEPPKRYQRVEIRFGSRQGPSPGADGRKGHRAWAGLMPEGWHTWWARTATQGGEDAWRAFVVPRREAIFLYVEDVVRDEDGDPFDEDEDLEPTWKLVANSSSGAEVPDDAESGANNEAVRAIVAQQREVEGQINSMRQELQRMQDRKEALHDQVRDAEARAKIAQQDAEHAQALLINERERLARESRNIDERLAREAKAIDEHLSARRALALEEEKRIQSQVQITMDSVKEAIGAMGDLTTNIMQTEATSAQIMANRKMLGVQNLDVTLAEQTRLEEIQRNLAQRDPNLPTPSGKLADKFAEMMTADNLTAVLGTILTLTGKAAPKPS